MNGKWNKTAPVTIKGDIRVGRLKLENGEFEFSGGAVIGNTQSSFFHPSLQASLEPLKDGTLHIKGVTGDETTLILKTTIDFSGKGTKIGADAGVQIDHGQIILLDGGHLGFSDAQNIHLSNNGAVEFHNTGNYIYKGIISGDGDISKRNMGTLTITKNQELTKDVIVLGGRLIIDNITINAGMMYVKNDATLQGLGQASTGLDPINIGSFYYSNILGTVEIGTPKKSIGTLTFASQGGKIILYDGAKIVVNIIGGKGAGLLASGGNINIENLGKGVELKLAKVGGKIAIGDTFHVVSALGDIIGDFSNTTVKDATGLYEFQIEKRDAADNLVAFGAPSKDIYLRAITVPAVVPEPSTYALCGSFAALAFALYRRRKTKKTIGN